MKNYLALIAISCSFCYNASSQDYTILNRYMDELNKLGESFSQVKSYREIQGSPYFNEEFSDGRIVTKDDKSVFLKLRYNIYSDEIEFLNNDKIYSIAKPVYIKEFCIGEQKIRFSTYLDGKFVKNGFLLVLTQGDYTLFVKKRIEFKMMEKQQPYSNPKPDRFVPQEDTFYLSAPNKPIQRVVSLKKMLKAFPELERIVSGYPEKKINFRNTNDLKSLIAFINSQSIKK